MSRNATKFLAASIAMVVVSMLMSCRGDTGDAGESGLSSLVSVSAEPHGENCAGGGLQVAYGQDVDRDGELDTDEISDLSFLCDDAELLLASGVEPPGDACPTGGYWIDTGRDADGDGTLSEAEVESTSYACSGDDGVPRSCTGYRLAEMLNLACDDGTSVQWDVGLRPSAGVFSDSGQVLGSDVNYFLALGDIDGDFDIDALLAGRDDDGSLWLNDGGGRFTKAESLQRADTGDSNRGSTYVDLGDVDGDGDLDALIALQARGLSIFTNDGQGAFVESQLLTNAQGGVFELGDLDNDGDLDVFILANSAGDVFINDGQGNFSDSGLSIEPSYVTDLALGDLDGDGDLDAFVGRRNMDVGAADLVFLNDGAGIFSDSGQTLGNDNLRAVALHDMDGDGDLDVVEANVFEPSRLLLNDGGGTFSYSGELSSSGSSWEVATGDVNGDGDVDVVTCDPSTSCVLWKNDGTSQFADSGQNLPTLVTAGLGLDDLDGDGDLDLFIAGSSGDGNRVWFNN